MGRETIVVIAQDRSGIPVYLNRRVHLDFVCYKLSSGRLKCLIAASTKNVDPAQPRGDPSQVTMVVSLACPKWRGGSTRHDLIAYRKPRPRTGSLHVVESMATSNDGLDVGPVVDHLDAFTAGRFLDFLGEIMLGVDDYLVGSGFPRKLGFRFGRDG